MNTSEKLKEILRIGNDAIKEANTAQKNYDLEFSKRLASRGYEIQLGIAIPQSLAKELDSEMRTEAEKNEAEMVNNSPMKRLENAELVNLIAPYWIEHQRNQICLYLSGYLKKSGYTLEHSEQIIRRICELKHDEEESGRLRTLRDTYEKDRVKGYTGLVEIIPKHELKKLQGNSKPIEIPALIRLGDRIREGVPEIKWLIQDIVPDRGITIWGGASGSYKTFAAMEAALAVSTGTDFLTQYSTIKCPVLYIDEENGDKTLISRFSHLMNGRDLQPEELNDIHLSIFHNIKLDEPTAHITLSHLINKTEAKLVVIDSMVRCMIGEEDKSHDVRLIFETLKKVMTQITHDTSFIILHHTSKAVKSGLNSLRGSGDFAALADTVLIFDGRKGYALVNQEKNRHISKEESEPFLIKLIPKDEADPTAGYKLIWIAQSDAQGLIDACADLIRDWFEAEKKAVFETREAQKMAEKEGYKHNTFNSALKKLLEEGELSKLKRGVYKVEGSHFVEEKLHD